MCIALNRVGDVKQMGFKFFSRILIALGIVLVAVVVVEFTLLTFYVKERDGSVIKAEQVSIVATERTEVGVKVVKENNENFTPAGKEREEVKHEEERR